MKNKRIMFAFFLSAALISFGVGAGLQHMRISTHNNNTLSSDKEIAYILLSHDIREQKEYYRALIERVGPERAQEALFKSGLTFTGQTHLLNHVVGEWLFEKSGVEGILTCKEYFLASCYHGLIIKAIGLYGSADAAARILAVCNDKSSAVLGQCVHALGHGLLAWNGYANLLESLHQCDSIIGRDKHQFAFSCYDGVFMENIWATHNGTPSPDRWIRPKDPHYPCSDPRISSTYLVGCWSNQPALMYQLFHGDIKKVGHECEMIKSNAYKTICFDGLARQIHPITNGNAQSADDLCSLMPLSFVRPCLTSIAKAAFSVGDRTMPFEICNKFAHDESCYAILVSMITADTDLHEDPHALCAKIEDNNWQQRCFSLQIR